MRKPLVALTGQPNSGKTALFNALTGSRQKVANYAGVTVEKRLGLAKTPRGQEVRVLDLPGSYSLKPTSLDEEVAYDVVSGTASNEESPSVLIAVADATHLERSLYQVLELKETGTPVVLALNMMDLAEKRGLKLDLKRLSQELDVPVVPTVAVKSLGLDRLMTETIRASQTQHAHAQSGSTSATQRYQEVDRILGICMERAAGPSKLTEALDRVLLHPIAGSVVLLGVLFALFQAVFAWSVAPTALIEDGVAGLAAGVEGLMNEGPLRSLLVDGVIEGVGAVVVFLPQILLLFLFVLALEDLGYMARAAFLMDRLMGSVGLNGRAFIPLLSSFACAIPGIMATRTIGSPRDRLTTILIAPLMTCSARLPVYTLLIAAFVPATSLAPGVGLQGLVMFGLYLAGVASALAVAWVLRKTLLQGPRPTLLMELPTYKVPSLRNLLMGLYERARVFLKRAGTIILSLTVVVWFLTTYPNKDDINQSYAAHMGRAIEPIMAPIGFDWQISMAMIPGFAAREVIVSALSTTYAVGNDDDEEAQTQALSTRIAAGWSLATALSLLVWFIFAPQCFSTLAVTKRETNSWRWPMVMLVYLLGLAYGASFITYQVFAHWGWG